MVNKKKWTALALAALFSVGVLAAGCGGEKKAAEKKPEKLTLYCGLMEDHMIKTVKEFEKDTGIKVEAVRMSSGEILGRINAEKNAPKASVWYGGPADGFIQAQEYGLLEKYVSPNAAKIPDKFKDKDGFWTGIMAFDDSLERRGTHDSVAEFAPLLVSCTQRKGAMQPQHSPVSRHNPQRLRPIRRCHIHPAHLATSGRLHASLLTRTVADLPNQRQEKSPRGLGITAA